MAGTAAFFAPESLFATPLATFGHLCLWLGLPTEIAGGVLIGAGLAALMAASSSFITTHTTNLVLLAPQQFLLCAQLVSISFALATGRYPDGYAPSGGAWFILSDQIWAWILALTHSVYLATMVWRRTSGTVPPTD